MHYLIAVICFVLALFGVDGHGHHTLVTRAVVDGVDVLYSKTQTIANVADITCLRSASGQCHYRLLVRDCAMPQTRTTTASACNDPPRKFALAVGASTAIAGLPASFTLCVGQDRDTDRTECDTLPAVDPLVLRW